MCRASGHQHRACHPKLRRRDRGGAVGRTPECGTNQKAREDDVSGHVWREKRGPSVSHAHRVDANSCRKSRGSRLTTVNLSETGGTRRALPGPCSYSCGVRSNGRHRRNEGISHLPRGAPTSPEDRYRRDGMFFDCRVVATELCTRAGGSFGVTVSTDRAQSPGGVGDAPACGATSVMEASVFVGEVATQR